MGGEKYPELVVNSSIRLDAHQRTGAKYNCDRDKGTGCPTQGNPRPAPMATVAYGIKNPCYRETERGS